MARAVKRAFRFRFYPTDAQAAELARTFGCVRLVYNMALAARTEAWTLRQERVNYHATSAMLTTWKKADNLAFLNEVSSVPLQQTLRHLQVAFTNFFAKRARYPSFKSKKKSRRSVEYTTSGFRWRDGQLTLAKMTEPLDIVWSRPLPEGARPSTVTVSQDPAGRWFVSLLCDDVIEQAPALGMVGVDAGLDSLLTLSTGEKIVNPRYERRDRSALAKAQRELARKAKGSHNRACSACGALAERMPLNMRSWTCRCGQTHDRDVNAARNILAEGLSVIACGGGVRPQRTDVRTGRSSTKQETQRTTAGIPRLQA
ncbi:RNA-guided endonuclease InsQ/TnpB family protein [Micromonospora sp. NPDC050187]|uniref:RNA-guided endonuclease InsQ/TnpB family protein n=1 Tax=Micromonospora sp. NPDC050187 TaxID=3364277 RepID=UPI0037B16108